MANRLNLLIQMAQSTLHGKGNKGGLPTPHGGKAAAEAGAPCEPAQPTSNAAEGDPKKCDPVGLNIESTRCDLHPLYVLRPVTIEMLTPGSDTPVPVSAAQCPKVGCDRHYSPEYGYFPFSSAEHSDASGAAVKIPCAIHGHRYMAVAKTNGNFAWACLQADCSQTAPFPSL